MQEKDLDNNTSQQEALKLDYTIQSPQDRVALVEKIIESTPPEKLTSHYLEIMSNYIIFAMTKMEKKQKSINTDNRMITINKRQISFEGLVGKFENGEDGVYNMFIESDKNIIFTPKIKITEQDLEEIPSLQELKDAIKQIEDSEKKAV